MVAIKTGYAAVFQIKTRFFATRHLPARFFTGTGITTTALFG